MPIPGEHPDEPLSWPSRVVLLGATSLVLLAFGYFLVDAIIG